ncbi:ABC transporter ATP-binding protein [Massilia sp. W12]|uniref:ABC transporter ATP-binding protein n=1 Tax=Massilia sp. W12 TaxID=3126507 RepID=UPI0030CE005A
MILELQGVSKLVGGETHIYPSDLKLAAGAINVLLGPTQAGKTSLMRLIAGLDQPSSGRVLVDGKDVTGVSVRERNLAMVYQQFINYPALTVFENIAAPLRIQKIAPAEIESRVRAIAEKLHIAQFLQRLPGELSGGQQQRTALARALIKQAPLVLLDEPLVNLDYKLREELREELAGLFVDGKTTVVYATTEPQEALLLGGHTCVMDAGRILQCAPALAAYNAPANRRVAEIFNDPPMNLLPVTAGAGNLLRLADGTEIRLSRADLQLSSGQACLLGVRCNHVSLHASADALSLPCVLDLAELSGSESFLHLHYGAHTLVAQLPGVHQPPLGGALQAHIRPQDIFVFDAQGALLSAAGG